MDKRSCPICDFTDAEYLKENISGTYNFVMEISCPRCGNYTYQGDLVSDRHGNRIKGIAKDDLYLFMGFTREQTIYDRRTDFKDIKEFVEYAIKQAPKEVDEKISILLLNIARLCQVPGKGVIIDFIRDFPLAYSRDVDEFREYMQYLVDGKFIKEGPSYNYTVTIEGWKSVREYKNVVNLPQCFVAMWFDQSMDNIYLKIEKAINDAGYKAIRVDKEHYTGDVTDKIITEIRRSKFIVADYTGQRHGVYYEAGFARGLGIETISTCQQDDIKNLHFDTSHLNHIPWKMEEDLYEKLKDRILAIYGEGPLKNSENK
jgi:hypothetical protein